MSERVNWPEGKDFAFTIFDDTDWATLDSVREVYALLCDCGFRTTKSVWSIRGSGNPRNAGSTCEDQDYLTWLYGLQDEGFEIGLHNVASGSSVRQETTRGLQKFEELFGRCPRSLSNHVGCEESIYWGARRLTGVRRIIYKLFTIGREECISRGHVEGDEYFWGDICREKVKYVRNFVFADMNTLECCPTMPYHDPERPYVNYWFASSDGGDVKAFNRCIAEKNQDRLRMEGGACIMYAHLAAGFYESGNIDPRFRVLLQRLSESNGWFVPVSTLLDYLLQVRGHHNISRRERSAIERKWLKRAVAIGAGKALRKRLRPRSATCARPTAGETTL